MRAEKVTFFLLLSISKPLVVEVLFTFDGHLDSDKSGNSPENKNVIGGVKHFETLRPYKISSI
jgi:hypothetical protein